MKTVLIAAVALFAGAAAATAQAPMDRLMAMDLNKDGAITKAEAQTARSAGFDRLDTNKDGYVTSAEMEARAASRREREMAPDTNKDGKISRDEFMGAPYRGFDRLDANKDGTVDAAELAKLRSMAAARKGS